MSHHSQAMSTLNDDFVELVFGDLKHFNIARDVPRLEGLVQQCQNNPEIAKKMSRALILWACELKDHFHWDRMVNYPKTMNEPNADYDRIKVCLNKLKVLIAEHYPQTLCIYPGRFGMEGSIKINLNDILAMDVVGTFPTLKQVVEHADKLKEASLGVILESINPKEETT